MNRQGLRAGIVLLALVAVGGGAARLSAQMPDPRQMSGIPRPDPALAAGTVTVRVIRGTFTDPVVSQTVELLGGAAPRQASTDEAGRAEFTGVTSGARLKAVATVAGERLESQEFAAPASGGIRLMLVAATAADPTAAPAAPSAASPAAAPAQPGSIVLGEESRFVFEMGDDGLNVFYVLQLVNAASTPVQTGPIIFELPVAASGAAVLDGSSPQASMNGRVLTITGPFAPGATLVQAAYTLRFKGSTLLVEQKLPARLMHVAVVAQKVGDLQLSSPQMPEQRTMPASGNLYIAGRGGPVEAGQTLQFSFSGMPHQPTWPRDIALGLALLILAGGAYSAFRAPAATTIGNDGRRELEGRRDKLFDELTALEVRHRDQTIDRDDYAARRRELVTALEQVYVALDRVANRVEDDEAAVGLAS